MIKVYIAELFEDIENDLRVNTSHSECLKETPQTFLDRAINIVLSVQIIRQALLRSIVLASNYFSDLVKADPTRVQKDLGSYFACLLL